MASIPFIGPAYAGRSENYSVQRCINWYLEGGKGKGPALLVGTPGLTAPRLELAGGGIRGMFKIDESTAVIVCGSNVYKVTSAYVTTLIGAVPDDLRQVQIAYNGVNVVIASGGNLYSLTLSGSSATLIRSSTTSVDRLGDYFIASDSGTGFFAWSNAVSTTFDPLNIQDTNAFQDSLVAVRVARRSAYMIGTKGIEAWYESGTSGDIPFSRIDGSAFEVGCIAKDSIAILDGLFWLGGSDNGAGSVWTMSGGAPKRISNPAIEFHIERWPDMTDAEAFTYSQEGHSFYVLSSNSGNETFVYDVTTDEWHQRASMADFDLLITQGAPGWNTTNESGTWAFTNNDFTAEAT